MGEAPMLVAAAGCGSYRPPLLGTPRVSALCYKKKLSVAHGTNSANVANWSVFLHLGQSSMLVAISTTAMSTHGLHQHADCSVSAVNMIAVDASFWHRGPVDKSMAPEGAGQRKRRHLDLGRSFSSQNNAGAVGKTRGTMGITQFMTTWYHIVVMDGWADTKAVPRRREVGRRHEFRNRSRKTKGLPSHRWDSSPAGLL